MNASETAVQVRQDHADAGRPRAAVDIGRPDQADEESPPSSDLRFGDLVLQPHLAGEIASAAGVSDAVAVDQLRHTVELARIRRVRRAGRINRVTGSLALLMLADFVSAAFALILCWPVDQLVAVLFIGIVLPVRGAWGMLRPRLRLSILEELPKQAVSASAGIGLGVALLISTGNSDRVDELGNVGGVFLLAAIATHAVTFAVLRRLRRRVGVRRRTLILGAGTLGRQVADGLLATPEFGLEPVGFIDPAAVDGSALPIPVLSADPHRLAELIVEHDISTAIVAFTSDDKALVDVMLTCTALDADILIVPRLFELASDNDKTDWVNGVPLVRAQTNVTNRPSWKIKRGFDVLAATLALVALSPILLAAAVAVVLDSGWPVLFRQRRIGVGGESFELFKFRSMRPASENEQQTQWNIAGDPRLSPIGKVLRRTSLDELPQLINILRGDMSIVGPRPERPAFVAQFSAEYDGYWARHRIPVGLTGWAQVNGLRGDTSIAQRARFDNYYIANWSLWLDVKIMLLTLREVFRASGR